MILIIYKEELTYQKNREELFLLLKNFDISNNYLIISLDELKFHNLDELIDTNKLSITHLFFYPRQIKIINDDKIFELISNYPVKKTIFIDDIHDNNLNLDIINKFDYKLMTYAYLKNKFIPNIQDNIIQFPHYINDQFCLHPQNFRDIKISILGHYLKKTYITRRYIIKRNYKINTKLKNCSITSFENELTNEEYYNTLKNSYASIATTTDRKTLYYPYIVSKYFEIPGCGALLLGHVLPEMEEEMLRCGIVDNLNYVKFKDTDELIEKCNYVFDPKNKDIIEEIRLNGYNLIKNNHLISHRIRDIINIFNS